MFKTDPAFSNGTVTVTLDGRQVALPASTSVAAGLLSIGEIKARKSPSSGKACGPHCLMGVCYECLMEIDGVKRQACMTEAAEGMVINRMLSGAEQPSVQDAGKGNGEAHE